MQQLKPYFYDGRVVFPEKTIKALVEVGLDRHTGLAAARGLSLDDRTSLDAIAKAIRALLRQVSPEHPLYSALENPDTWFMLTGKAAHTH